ncbi:hypothetical protein V1527DRAFT_485451 [Lipomyces starkeyi]
MAWISEGFQDDTELRGYLRAIGNTIWYCMYAWFPVVAFPASKAPHYPWGYWAAFGTAVANIIGIYTRYHAVMWDDKRRGLVRNKFGFSLGEINGGDILENTYEVGSIDIERDSDLIESKKE